MKEFIFLSNCMHFLKWDVSFSDFRLCREIWSNSFLSHRKLVNEMRMISGIKLYLGLIVLISHAITDQLGCSNEEYKFQIKMNSILKMCNEERSFHCDRFSFFFCFFLLMEFFLLPQKARSILFDAINWSTIFFFFDCSVFEFRQKTKQK